MKKQKSRKKYYDLQRIMKGAANHRRIEILFLLKRQTPLSTIGIVEELEVNYQTGAAHVQRLVRASLVSAYPKGNETLHELTPLGETIMKLLINM